MTRNTALRLLTLLATLFVITAMPGSSILDLNIDVGTKVLAYLRRIHGLGATDCPFGRRLPVGA